MPKERWREGLTKRKIMGKTEQLGWLVPEEVILSKTSTYFNSFALVTFTFKGREAHSG